MLRALVVTGFVLMLGSSCNCGVPAAGDDGGSDASLVDDGGARVGGGVGGGTGTGGSGGGATGGSGGGATGGSGGGSATDAGADAGAACTGRFLPLGDLDGGVFSSVANALSSDGTTIVGQSTSGRGVEAMRWRLETGMVGLGGLSAGGFGSTAYDVSADGGVVVGVSQSSLVDCPGRVDEAFRWTAAGGMSPLGDLSTGCFFSVAYGVSADGAKVVGGATNALTNTAAFWSAGNWQDLGFAMSLGNSSSVDDLTPDETVAVGTQRFDATASYQVFRWQADAGQELLGDLDGGDVYAGALGVSDDGSVVVGFASSANGVEAFRWTRGTGLTGLGDFGSGAFGSQALALTADGTLIVGFGTTDAGTEAALWPSSLVMTSLASELTRHGVTIPTGWLLRDATGVSVNGREVTFAGNALNAAGAPEAWTATYCQP
jgi:probable HAF family extracellular repeat protein